MYYVFWIDLIFLMVSGRELPRVLIWKRERHLRVEIYMTYDIVIYDT